MIQLEGAVSLVTGSSRGIGRAIALKLAEAGSDVVVTYLNSPRDARDVAEKIEKMGRRAWMIKVDFSEEDDILSLAEILRQEVGRLDVVVNNAAGGGFRPLMDATLAQYEYAMRINVRALMLLVQHAAPLLQKKSLDRAKLITLSSMGGARALPMYGLIGAAKGAIESMTRHLAYELGPKGINVNCICAGLVDTGAISFLPDKEKIFEARRTKSLIGPVDLLPEDVANVALFLASPLANKIQGQTLVVDGGVSIQV